MSARTRARTRAPLRVAIAGFGLAGEVFHAPLVAATEGLELVAVTAAPSGRGARTTRTRASRCAVVPTATP